MVYHHFTHMKTKDQIEEFHDILDGKTEAQIRAKQNVRALKGLPIGQVN